MKAVFPCNGVVVVTKQNVDMLTNFYEGNLINSKLYPAYVQNNFPVQVGAFNYMPQNSKIILDKNAHLLTIRELNNVLSQTTQKPVEQNKVATQEPANAQVQTQTTMQKNENKPIEDNEIINHPFFATLKPIN